MKVVVADANVFVYLFLTNVLAKILAFEGIEIKVTQAVFKELAHGARIPHDYPALRDLINEAIHNRSLKNNIELITLETMELADETLKIYFNLIDFENLDDGENESIPLAFELDALFVTNDQDALVMAESIGTDYGKNISLSFMNFCEQMAQIEVISKQDLEDIKNLFI